ncbi:MAG: PssD/Cps14F family polysaccharide biosynthesis glycosyltransferase [Candidatus Aenigmatarchaeota archaeon]
MKICVICAPGGHLTQFMQLKKLWKRYDVYFVVPKHESSKNLGYRSHYIKDPFRNPLYYIITILQSFGIFLKERPDAVITNGGGLVVPMCYIAKLFRKKIVFIESFSRVKTRSVTGRVLYPIADLFLVQWRALLKKYGPKAKYGGSVF